MPRTRLDAALVERGLAPSRSRAQAVVAAGLVRVNGTVIARPAMPVPEGATLVVDAPPPFVSRGGEKLRGALADFGVDVTGAVALDLGASTGGFTDCLLQGGAAHVTAVDVGYGQLAWTLRNDPRVRVLERTNARTLRPGDVGPADLVTCDLAFIGVGTVWPAVVPLLTPDYRALVLVKPQFEVGRGHVGSGGVVRDPALHHQAIVTVAGALRAGGGRIAGVAPSRLVGPKGNREFFLHAVGPERPGVAIDVDAAAAAAVEAR
jgi:23S rRNA (cytidine1920-2'-O)/16S rRNA (cytidine1409-2'-O)-methyltransferase